MEVMVTIDGHITEGVVTKQCNIAVVKDSREVRRARVGDYITCIEANCQGVIESIEHLDDGTVRFLF